MARNEEKHYGRLNRLILSKEKEEFNKKNPLRPKLNTLNTPEEIRMWLPSIKKDMDFYLKKSMVTCYSDDHVKECRIKVNNLEQEFKAFVRKLAILAPEKLDAVPWTPRAYKRKTEIPNEGPSNKKEFVPIATPILDKEKAFEKPVLPVIDSTLMDQPLDFDFQKMESCKYVGKGKNKLYYDVDATTNKNFIGTKIENESSSLFHMERKEKYIVDYSSSDEEN